VTVVNRLLGLVLGLAVAAAGVVVVGEVALAISDREPWLVDRSALDRHFSQLTWTNRDVLPVSVLLIVIGLVLLVLQLKPRRPSTLRLPSDELRRASIERRGVEGRLATVAQQEDDVVRASAKVSRSRATVDVTAEHGTDQEAIGRRLHQALTSELDRIGITQPLRLKISPAPRPR
jgi:hypothetical protein